MEKVRLSIRWSVPVASTGNKYAQDWAILCETPPHVTNCAAEAALEMNSVLRVILVASVFIFPFGASLPLGERTTNDVIQTPLEAILAFSQDVQNDPKIRFVIPDLFPVRKSNKLWKEGRDKCL